jgi:hypothetical protein
MKEADRGDSVLILVGSERGKDRLTFRGFVQVPNLQPLSFADCLAVILEVLTDTLADVRNA